MSMNNTANIRKLFKTAKFYGYILIKE